MAIPMKATPHPQVILRRVDQKLAKKMSHELSHGLSSIASWHHEIDVNHGILRDVAKLIMIE